MLQLKGKQDSRAFAAGAEMARERARALVAAARDKAAKLSQKTAVAASAIGGAGAAGVIEGVVENHFGTDKAEYVLPVAVLVSAGAAIASGSPLATGVAVGTAAVLAHKGGKKLVTGARVGEVGAEMNDVLNELK